ncbi:hypothetical protein QQF64_035756 [Cirrhinus molitorella]|uniref:Uncharacterized protein n=1 Tax=Cirrhinus molitorella TaxID=172907 RepID=A0ABR3NGN2_9TELE
MDYHSGCYSKIVCFEAIEYDTRQLLGGQSYTDKGMAPWATSVETLDMAIRRRAAMAGSFSLNAQRVESPVTMEGATGLSSSSDFPQWSCMVKRIVNKVLRTLILNQDCLLSSPGRKRSQVMSCLLLVQELKG